MQDLDGVADAWEAAHGLHSAAATDSSADRDGDNNIEEYVNELAESLVGK